MSTLGGAVPDISVVTKIIDPNGDAARIAYVLKQTNAIIDDIPFEAGNLTEGHRSTVEVSLPSVSVRSVNSGVSATFGADDQIDDACAVFESKSEIDRLAAETGGMQFVKANRANQARKHIQAHGQNFARVLIYGSPSVTGEFVGIANRLNTLTGNTADNVFDCGGSGSDLTSIYGIAWGKGRVMGIYPRGTVGGLQRTDQGLVDIQTGAVGMGSATVPGYREYFTWRCGLAVPDWRYMTRACNIDVSDLNANGADAAPLIDIMIAMREAIPDDDDVTFIYYMNRAVRRQLRIQIKDAIQAGGGLRYDNYAGRRTLMFEDSPVRISDQIVSTETAVA